MIQPNELRIGNLISQRVYGVCSVTAIKEKYIATNLKEGEGLGVSNELFEPIPLTEEWLLKFGFKKEEHEYIYISLLNSNKFSLIQCFGTFEAAINDKSITWQNMKFVHQLQNLYFALTGEELQLE